LGKQRKQWSVSGRPSSTLLRSPFLGLLCEPQDHELPATSQHALVRIKIVNRDWTNMHAGTLQAAGESDGLAVRRFSSMREERVSALGAGGCHCFFTLGFIILLDEMDSLTFNLA